MSRLLGALGLVIGVVTLSGINSESVTGLISRAMNDRSEFSGNKLPVGISGKRMTGLNFSSVEDRFAIIGVQDRQLTWIQSYRLPQECYLASFTEEAEAAPYRLCIALDEASERQLSAYIVSRNVN